MENKKIISLGIAKKISQATGAPIWFVGEYDKMPENTLAEKLKKAMFFRGHNSRECAKEVGSHHQAIQRYLKGDMPKFVYIKEGIEKYLLILTICKE